MVIRIGDAGAGVSQSKRRSAVSLGRAVVGWANRCGWSECGEGGSEGERESVGELCQRSRLVVLMATAGLGLWSFGKRSAASCPQTRSKHTYVTCTSLIQRPLDCWSTESRSQLEGEKGGDRPGSMASSRCRRRLYKYSRGPRRELPPKQCKRRRRVSRFGSHVSRQG